MVGGCIPHQIPRPPFKIAPRTKIYPTPPNLSDNRSVRTREVSETSETLKRAERDRRGGVAEMSSESRFIAEQALDASSLREGPMRVRRGRRPKSEASDDHTLPAKTAGSTSGGRS